MHVLHASLRWSHLALAASLGLGAFTTAHAATEPPHPPAVGTMAPDFTLAKLDGGKVQLSKLTAGKTVLLVVLRGWPGYQCPICSRQVNDFIAHREEFTRRGVEVVMVYPGPADDLQAHAEEFRGMGGRQWPEGWNYLLDSDYSFTNAWGLRWDAPRETAYPSTFILTQGNAVKFAQTSTTHGGRVSAEAAVAALGGLGMMSSMDPMGGMGQPDAMKKADDMGRMQGGEGMNHDMGGMQGAGKM